MRSTPDARRPTPDAKRPRAACRLSATRSRETAMSILVFLRELAGLTALFGTLFVWTLLGHAAGF
ncbi:hypothetical protein [Azospirillum argentinense]